MTKAGVLFLSLTAIVAALAGVLAFAVTKLIATARSRGLDRKEGAETAFMAAAMEQAVERMRTQERALRERAEASERLSQEKLTDLEADEARVSAKDVLGS